MKRIDTSIEKVKNDIRHFYQPELHHFIVMNGVDLGETIEVQWFFSEYNEPFETIVFCAQISPATEIPTMTDIISSAWVAEAELVDLLDIKIENTTRGFVLEPDSETGPLRKKKQDVKTV
jgi:NADH:ubiquinone oxidoreductase subunit C